MMKITRNIAQCKKCGEVIESKSDNDYQTCSCGSVSVDGGTYHLSRTGAPGSFIELSEFDNEIDQEILDRFKSRDLVARFPLLVSAVIPRDDYKLSIMFNDGIYGLVSLKDRLFGPMFEPLLDPDRFSEVGIDEHGVIAWPNGADLDTLNLYKKVYDQHYDDLPEFKRWMMEKGHLKGLL